MKTTSSVLIIATGIIYSTMNPLFGATGGSVDQAIFGEWKWFRETSIFPTMHQIVVSCGASIKDESGTWDLGLSAAAGLGIRVILRPGPTGGGLAADDDLAISSRGEKVSVIVNPIVAKPWIIGRLVIPPTAVSTAVMLSASSKSELLSLIAKSDHLSVRLPTGYMVEFPSSGAGKAVQAIGECGERDGWWNGKAPNGKPSATVQKPRPVQR